MLFLDGVYVERHDGTLRFRWVTAPTSAELARLTQALALRIGRYLERQGLLERDAQHCYFRQLRRSDPVRVFCLWTTSLKAPARIPAGMAIMPMPASAVRPAATLPSGVMGVTSP